MAKNDNEPKKAEYVVAERKCITHKRKLLAPGDEVRSDDFEKDVFDALIKRKDVEKVK